MKSKFLDSLMAAIGNKDEAGMKTALVKVIDEAREEEETKRKEEEESKDKARDARTAQMVNDAIKAAFKARDEQAEAEKKKAEDKAKDDEQEKADKKKEEDDELEQELEEESGSKDARKAKDSALLSESFESVKMHAEIIAPGVQIPTFDAAADPKKTFRDCHCGLRRKALTMATQDAATADLVTAVRGRTVDAAEIAKLPCGQVRTLFNGVAAMKRLSNNGAAVRDGAHVHQVQNPTKDSPMDRFKTASAARWGFDKK